MFRRYPQTMPVTNNQASLNQQTKMRVLTKELLGRVFFSVMVRGSWQMMICFRHEQSQSKQPRKNWKVSDSTPKPSPESFQQGSFSVLRGGAWHSTNWQKLHWFIVFYISTCEAWGFVWGDKPTKAHRGDSSARHKSQTLDLPNSIQHKLSF